jgi:pilus assembly protein CpaB
VLLSLALACGGLAASHVHTRAQEVEAAVGPLVPVVVARGEVAPRTRLRPGHLAVKQVPERFVPRDALVSPDQVIGRRVAGALAAGGYVTQGALATGTQRDRGPGGAQVRGGERSIDVAVAGGEALAGIGPGMRVDVLVTTEPRSGGAAGRTYLALQDVELLGARPAAGSGAGGGNGAAAHATTVATLRVTLREAVFLTAAQSFARELRLLVRAPGDNRTARPLAVDGGGL